MHTIYKRSSRAASALIEAGADVNARGGAGVTALIMAAGYGETDVVRAVLTAGADPRAATEDGIDAVWSAAGGGAIADITDGPPLGACFPDTVGGPYLSTPIVSDMVGAPGGPMRVLLARRTFAAGSRLLCEFEVQNATAASGGEPRVSAGHAIRDASGHALTESPATPLVRSPNGRLARQIWISLERTPPGRYELVVRAKDEVRGTELLALEEFDVVASAAAP